MAISLWVSVLVAVIAGIFGGIVAPLFTGFLSQVRWQRQKRFELKYDAFRGAINALASWETDAMDQKLQSNKVEYKGSIKRIELRPATSETLEHYKGLIEALFSNEIASKYHQVLHAHISIDNVPNEDFEKLRVEFVKLAASDLGLQE